MPSVGDILFSRTLPRVDRLRYRLPVYALIAAGVGAALLPAAGAVYQGAETNYGCADGTITPGKGAIAGALAARNQLGLESNPGLDDALTHAAQEAQSTYAAAHDGNAPDAGAVVTACVEHNPLNPAGFGNGGWTATAEIQG